MSRMIEHPYGNLTGGKWVKGNFHTHTTASDGERPHQEVIDDYAGRDYGFLMISDHDIFTSAEDYARFDSRGLILIPGNEISARGPDLLHVGAKALTPPHADRQRVIDATAEDGGFIIVNHPNWGRDFNHCPQEMLENWQGYIGLEIYNGVISRLFGSPYATNRWDMLLSKGRRLWGFANDDSHKSQGDVGLGWNCVYTKDATTEGVLEALAGGRFYTSTGVEILSIRVEGYRIDIQTKNAVRIVALHDHGQRFDWIEANSISTEAPREATYVRFECWGKGEAFAWTQPFFVDSR